MSPGHRIISAMNKKNRGGGAGAAGGGVDRSKGGHMAGGSQSRCETENLNCKIFCLKKLVEFRQVHTTFLCGRENNAVAMPPFV